MCVCVERSRGNPTASKTAAPDPTRQNPPDRSRSQNLPSLHLPRLQVPNQYLVQLVRTSPEQLKQEERELLHTWKKAIYEDVLRTVKNMSDLLLFKDHRQDPSKLLRALRRRDLPVIIQAVQTSPRFYTICENCGLFDVEPLLWDMVCHDIHEIQAGRL